MTVRSIAKDFYKLQKNIASFSNGEARILSFDDDLTKFEVELNIKDGFYKGGVFVFEVTLEGYPNAAPYVWFNTPIFHPNIGDGFDNREICLNLLDKDWDGNDLEDVVHGMLFLVKNPNPDDALNPFSGRDDEHFAILVRQSLEGGEVLGAVFERNPGLVQQDKLVEQPEMSSSTTIPEIAHEVSEATNSTVESLENPCRTSLLPISTMKISSRDELYHRGLYWIYKHFTNISRNGKLVCGRGGCPKWLARLAVLMFGDTRNEKERVNILSKNLGSFQRFSFLGGTIMLQK